MKSIVVIKTDYKRIAMLCLYESVLCIFLFCVSSSPGSVPDYNPGEVIVKFTSEDRSVINAFMNRIGAYSFERAFPEPVRDMNLSRIYKLKFFTGASVLSIIRQCKNDPAVEYAQPNYLNHLCLKVITPNDFFYNDQWALKAIDAPSAWETEKGDPGVIIAVIDTGVDYNHEDLSSRIWNNSGEVAGNGVDDDGNGYVDDIRGWDFADTPEIASRIDQTGRDNDPMDENGHGTHVAGIIAAVPDNHIGIAGITWDCRIMALRAGGDFLEDDDASAAIVYAADNGARIINMSWGGEEFSYIIKDAVEYAYSRGCVLVGAVGNDNRPAVIYPAFHKHVIAVGATNKQDKKASFSNYGAGVDIVAPGDRVFGTVLKNSYSDWSGTSMASPVVCGVIALMVSRRPGLTSEEIFQILRTSADKIDEPLFAGAGRVNAAKALAASSSLIAHITSPENGEYANTEFIINGNVAGSNFKGFLLEYSNLSDLKNWFSISAYQETLKIGGTLETWNTTGIDEGAYAVRLKVFGDGSLEAEDRVILNVDHSPPVIEQLHTALRLDGDMCKYAVSLKTDDLTTAELCYRSMADIKKLSTSNVTREHEIYLPDELVPSSYEYFVTVTNLAGMSIIDDNKGSYYTFKINPLKLSSDGFIERKTGIPAMYPISGTADFDEDSQPEIIGMERPEWDYSLVKIYEKSNGAYNNAWTSNIDYFPRDVGDTDGDGLFEILGNKRDAVFLFECPSSGSYPTKKIWEMKGLLGSQIADSDLDGRKEILSSHFETNEIYIYENRGNNFYLRVARLRNPTDGNNYLAPTFAIADLDGDSRMEIAAGDADGDLFIYKNTDDDKYTHIWSGNLPQSNIRNLTTGDFDGDGKNEFIVEAQAVEPFDRMKKRWIYTIFDNVSQDEYKIIWSVEILGTKSRYGVSAGDVDGDGQDEIAILVTPNLYILKVPDEKKPFFSWHHSASDTYHPIIEDIDKDGINDILFNDGDELLSFSLDPTADSPIRRPWGLSAVLLNETELELRWNGPINTRSYKIYRGTDKDALKPIAIADPIENSSLELNKLAVSFTSGYFHDPGLKTNLTYWYSVLSINEAGQESDRSEGISITPNPPPKLLSAKYAPPSLYLTFDEPLGQSASNSMSYIITSETGLKISPSSAIIDHQEKRVILTLSGLLQGTYTVTVSGVRDATGVPVSDSNNSAKFQVPAQKLDQWSDIGSMIVYPNPVMPNSRHPGRITFDRLPSDTIVYIFDSSGKLVKKLDNSGFQRIWYLDNDANMDVASGVYIYVAEYAGYKKTGTIAIIR